MAPPPVPAELRAFGKEQRRRVPRAAHAEWSPGPDRRDPLAILIEQGQRRIQSLLPVRYARMLPDPLAFLRGAAAVMAADLASAPSTDLRTQLCGDCHLANFGTFATPEGVPVFDVNDFDETLPGPFEWDVKRLAASFAVAAHVKRMSEGEGRALAGLVATAYRKHMTHLAGMPPFDSWNERIDLPSAVSAIAGKRQRRLVEARLRRVLQSGAAQFGIVEHDGDRLRLHEKPDLVYRLDEQAWPARDAFGDYLGTLQPDRQALLRRYTLEDVAFKVVGVGSVGTFCAIGLLVAGDGSSLLLQIKEAQESVLEPYAGASACAQPGERVVTGQRLMQAASDIFLGWTRAPVDGRSFYVRHLKDSRLAGIGTALDSHLPFYANLCGRTLARAHARAGEPAAIAGYMGAGGSFDRAIERFASAYAEQTVRDWRSLIDAVQSGRIIAGHA
ncbi:MAG: DUF2252 domain-containing protein [Acetobacteraceae bacterium]|nr:DUF2252 domain-containing protein [Acetobacteraceae bacterium]